MKKRFSSICQRWYLFLGFGALVGVVLCGFINLRTKPTASQRLHMYVASYGVDSAAMVKKAKERISSDTYETKVYSSYIDENNAIAYFNYIQTSCDFAIVPEGWMLRIYQNSLSLTQEMIRAYLPSLVDQDFYSYEEKSYGLKIYDSKTKNGYLADYITYEEDEKTTSNYYLVFLASSKQIGGMNGSEKEDALRVLEAYLS